MKWVLVTGASGGIGESLCRTLAAAGYNLVMHGHTQVDALQELKKELLALHAIEMEVVAADFSSLKGVSDLVNALYMPIDAIIHNSGIAHYGLLPDMSDDEVNKILHVNLLSPMLLTKQLLPAMIKKKAGTILFISSIWGERGASCEVVYSTTKGGINTFVKSLAKEVGPSNIRVNAIAPGAVATKMMADFTDEELQQLAQDIPMGRLAQPDEISSIALFLLSQHSSYINGHILDANGGW
ncbi:3-ketoacyl-(acyl-carrier-protein) reductase [Fictibacillus macauensis ZFHKF-1]|uniref:3-ketoacyl-(Acyl-carrier-protein) reductase n=1 Tax=Fictibacillus macauensis ZFHKF-1 TaxID=1196324 RepID=I8UE08_9BACL|nr:SDR family oxidoreductase [Fictibacillus macauensis]EIT85145.1 3-ketoacyl-(acyl-carrier-protein) reductase [Fictibacillus macauensis ZFHKF-1]